MLLFRKTCIEKIWKSPWNLWVIFLCYRAYSSVFTFLNDSNNTALSFARLFAQIFIFLNNLYNYLHFSPSKSHTIFDNIINSVWINLIVTMSFLVFNQWICNQALLACLRLIHLKTGGWSLKPAILTINVTSVRYIHFLIQISAFLYMR